MGGWLLFRTKKDGRNLCPYPLAVPWQLPSQPKMLASLLVASAGHVPPSPAEMAHLHKLQRGHAARPARQLAAAPDYTCSGSAAAGGVVHDENWKVSGTSLGGWLVLEPWITPSLFYQFLGADQTFGPSIEAIKEKTGMDHKSFCTALGPYEANHQLRRHWSAWLTEDHIVRLKATGSTHVRPPHSRPRSHAPHPLPASACARLS